MKKAVLKHKSIKKPGNTLYSKEFEDVGNDVECPECGSFCGGRRYGCKVLKVERSSTFISPIPGNENQGMRDIKFYDLECDNCSCIFTVYIERGVE